MNIIPVDIGIEQVRRVFLTGKIHAHIAHLYLPQSYPYRIDYFAASDPMNPTKSLEGLENSPEVPVRRDYLGPWHEIADGGIEVNPIPGSHSAMMEEPNVQVLAASLKRCIDRACDRLHKK